MKYVYFALYILVINSIGFFVMYLDKQKAKKNKWRISEKALFVIAIMLGGIGIYIGIYKFRHKTLHLRFTIGIPICIILNIFSVYLILHYDILTKLFNLWINYLIIIILLLGGVFIWKL